MGATIYVASTTSSTTSTARLWWALNGQGQLRRVDIWSVGGVQASKPAVYIASTLGTVSTTPSYTPSVSIIDGHALNTSTSGGWLASSQWTTAPSPNPTVEALNIDPTYQMVVTNVTGTTFVQGAGQWCYQWPEGVGPTVSAGDNGSGTIQKLPIVVVFEVVGAATNTATAGVTLYWQPLVES